MVFNVCNNVVNIMSNNNNNVSLSEKINIDNFKWLMKNIDSLDIFNDDQKNQIKSMQKLQYKQVGYDEIGALNIKYKFKSNNKFGRVYQDVKGKGLQQQSRKVRDLLCHTNNGEPMYIDVDMVNAHPKLIITLCKIYDFDCDKVEEYVVNREVHLKNVMDYHQCSRKQAKLLFIRLLYSGGIDGWFLDHKLIRKKPLEFIESFHLQMKSICNKFYNHRKFIRNSDEADNKKAVHNKQYCNVEATCMSYIIAEYENSILHVMCDFFESKEYIVGVLCYDGLMIENNNTNIKEYFDECIELIKEKTGFDIELDTKSLDSGVNWNDIKKSYECGDFNENDIELGDYYDVAKHSTITDKLPIKDYNMKKYYFEKHIYFSTAEQCFFIRDKYSLIKYEINKLILYMKCIKTKIPKDVSSCFRFIDYYVNEDCNTKVYRGICYKPVDPFTDKLITNEEDKINKFVSYKNNIKPKPEINMSYNYLPPLLTHLKRFCENDDCILKYVLSLFAWKVRDPFWNAQICIVVKSTDEGAGKSCVMEIFRKMFGCDNVNYYHTLGQYSGKHSKRCGESLITCVDELSQDRRDNDKMEQFYSDITSNKVVIEPKFINAYEVENTALTFAFTNKWDGLKVNTNSSSNRRFCCAEFAEDKVPYPIKSEEYKLWLLKNIIVFQENKDALSQFFWFLYDYDKLSKEELKKLPESKGMKSLRNLNARIEQVFINDYLFVDEEYKELDEGIEGILADNRYGANSYIRIEDEGNVVVVDKKRIDGLLLQKLNTPNGYIKNKLVDCSKGISIHRLSVNRKRIYVYRFELPIIKESLSFLQ